MNAFTCCWETASIWPTIPIGSNGNMVPSCWRAAASGWPPGAIAILPIVRCMFLCILFTFCCSISMLCVCFSLKYISLGGKQEDRWVSFKWHCRGAWWYCLIGITRTQHVVHYLCDAILTSSCVCEDFWRCLSHSCIRHIAMYFYCCLASVGSDQPERQHRSRLEVRSMPPE